MPSLRRRAYLALEASSPVASLVDHVLVTLIVFNIAAVVFESVPSIEDAYRVEFQIFDLFSIAVFTVEYIARLWAAVEIHAIRKRGAVMGRLAFALRPSMIIDFLAFAPSYLMFMIPGVDTRLLRVFRLLRFLKLVRFSPAMTTMSRALYGERRALIGALVLMVGTAVFSGAIMHAIEVRAQPEKFGTIPDGMWWALSTLTTIGYGDVVPITPLGKLFGACVMIFGLGLFALPIGIIATAFVNEIHRRDFVVTWGMVARVPLFSTLDAQSISEIMNIMRTRMVEAGTVIAARGDEAEGMYFLADGEVHIKLPRHTLTLGPGDFFGEVTLLKKVQRLGTVTAASRCHLMMIDSSDFNALMQRNDELRERITAIADERLAGDWADVTGDVLAEELAKNAEPLRSMGDPIV
ncbi:MAG: cyclic nucleotide-gated ion channel/potassium channel family protein [Alphaproteobacteria bacterium]|nr:cyclic nucleotide-gated ion channel/potassium channel family protein [Alphaproteobacteria bacterium]